MRQFSLTTQMILLFAISLFAMLAINITTLAEARRSTGLEIAIAPAAQQLAKAVAEQSRPTDPAKRTASEVSMALPAVAESARIQSAERRVGAFLAQNQVKAQEVRAFHTTEGWQDSGSLHLAAKLDDGRWISVRAPGPPPFGPLVARLVLQLTAIYLLIALPALIALRRSASAMERLTQAAASPVVSRNPEPIAEEGPRDVRGLIRSFNAMRDRIAAAIQDRDVMLGAVAHDLRTPLTALRLEAEGVAEPAARDALVTQIESISGQFAEIMDLARFGQTMEIDELVDLSGLVDALPARILPADVGRVSVRHGGEAIVVGNRSALTRLIDNLVDNGLRYGHRVDVELGSAVGVAIIRVTDDGPGIAMDQIADVLRPFGRLEHSRNADGGGHGLGLAIVDRIVAAHHGILDFDRAPTGGLMVSVRLPLASDQSGTKLSG